MAPPDSRGRALTRRSLLAGAAAGVLAANGGRAKAQSFPSGPVKIIVGTGPGSSPDVISRVVAEHLSRQWGQQVLVLNQPGGGGSISIRAAGNAPPDGHTLYFALGSNFLTLPEFRAGLPFDVAREFVPIGYVGEHPMVIATHPSLGINTLPELMDYARKRPGQLNVASGNRGSIIHLTGEWLRKAIGVDMTLVNYPGTPQAMADLLGGRIQVHVDAVSSLAGSINAGTHQGAGGGGARAAVQFPRPADRARDHSRPRGDGLVRDDGAAQDAGRGRPQGERRPAGGAGQSRAQEALPRSRHLPQADDPGGIGELHRIRTEDLGAGDRSDRDCARTMTARMVIDGQLQSAQENRENREG